MNEKYMSVISGIMISILIVPAVHASIIIQELIDIGLSYAALILHALSGIFVFSMLCGKTAGNKAVSVVTAVIMSVIFYCYFILRDTEHDLIERAYAFRYPNADDLPLSSAIYYLYVCINHIAGAIVGAVIGIICKKEKMIKAAEFIREKICPAMCTAIILVLVCAELFLPLLPERFYKNVW